MQNYIDFHWTVFSLKFRFDSESLFKVKCQTSLIQQKS